MKHTTVCIFSVLGGMVLGSAIALALAPKSDSVLASDLVSGQSD